MPPIPIYTKSPINAAKADGVTPQTAEVSEKQSQPQPQTTTAAPYQQQSAGYPPAQPGAVPSLPAVTAVPSSQYAPLQPTPTSSLGYQGPPPPQPGAVPVAPGSVPQTAAASGPPPPATVTEPARLPGQGPPVTSTYPHQMAIPPPTVPQAQRGTSTAFVVPYSAGQADTSHPPGYQQNVNADQFTSSQREGHHTAVQQSSNWGLGSSEGGGRLGDSDEGVWGAARKWAQAAGDKLSAAENEVWKRINKKE